MPQFVILRHTLPEGSERPSHFDLMLEDDGVLLTWALAELPSPQPQPAEELPPHRLHYLSYEGPVSHNRGAVLRVATGTFEWVTREPERLELELDDGQRLCVLKLTSVAKQWSVVCDHWSNVND